MFPKWENLGGRVALYYIFANLINVCLDKTVSPAFILLQYVVSHEVYKENVASHRDVGKGRTFPPREGHSSRKSWVRMSQDFFFCRSPGALLKSLRIWWLFWESFKVIIMLHIWVAPSGFQSGFMYFFLFRPQNGPRPMGAAVGWAHLVDGCLWMLAPTLEKGGATSLSRASIKLPLFVWLMAKPGDEGSWWVFLPDPQ